MANIETNVPASGKWTAIALCLLSVAVLFCGFQWNLWHVADATWFTDHQRDSEAHVIGRLLKSHADGMMSDAGLLGIASPTVDYLDFNDKDFDTQFEMYFNSRPCRAYTPYMSNIGWAGMVLGPIDLLPLSPRLRLKLLHAFTSLLTAIALTLIILWFYREHGLLAALAVLATAAISPWLTVFGRNLYWCLWVFYIPLIASAYFLRRNSNMTVRRAIAFAAIIFAAILIKCLVTGFEYISTVLITPLVPWVYYSLLRPAPLKEIFRGTVAAVLGGCLAVAVSLAILFGQISFAMNSTDEAFRHIGKALVKRTYADAEKYPELTKSLSASLAQVLGTYLNGSFFDSGNYDPMISPFPSRQSFHIQYWHLLILFAVASLAAALRAKGCRGLRSVAEQPRSSRRRLALIAAAWFSILAPLSWFIIFKSHSYVHTQMNFIVWQMPFTLFGFALVGAAITQKTTSATNNTNKDLLKTT